MQEKKEKKERNLKRYSHILIFQLKLKKLHKLPLCFIFQGEIAIPELPDEEL